MKPLLKHKNINNLDVENPNNFPNAKRILTAVRIGVPSQKHMEIQEANHEFGMFSPLACFINDNVRKLNKFCCGWIPLFIHPFMFPLDIGGLCPGQKLVQDHWERSAMSLTQPCSMQEKIDRAIKSGDIGGNSLS